MFFKNIINHILFILYFIIISYILILTNKFNFENLGKGLAGINKTGFYINQFYCFLKFTNPKEITIVAVICPCFFLSITILYSVFSNSHGIVETFHILNKKIEIKNEYISFFLFLIINFFQWIVLYDCILFFYNKKIFYELFFLTNSYSFLCLYFKKYSRLSRIIIIMLMFVLPIDSILYLQIILEFSFLIYKISIFISKLVELTDGINLLTKYEKQSVDYNEKQDYIKHINEVKKEASCLIRPFFFNFYFIRLISELFLGINYNGYYRLLKYTKN